MRKIHWIYWAAIAVLIYIALGAIFFPFFMFMSVVAAGLLVIVWSIH